MGSLHLFSGRNPMRLIPAAVLGLVSFFSVHCHVRPIGSRCDDTAREIREICYVSAASDFFARQALISDPANTNQASANNSALGTALLACIAYEDILCD